jgi:hypothetical protein
MLCPLFFYQIDRWQQPKIVSDISVSAINPKLGFISFANLGKYVHQDRLLQCASKFFLNSENLIGFILSKFRTVSYVLIVLLDKKNHPSWFHS